MTAEATRRRHDDVVSYREMVDYTSNAIEDFHRSRSETLLQLNARLEQIIGQFEEHNRWHRDELASMISRAPAMRASMIAIILSTITALTAIAALLAQHWRG